MERTRGEVAERVWVQTVECLDEHMETELLRTFVLVSEELNFTRAAERLHLSQPSLSRRVRDLEQILGGRLFDRGPRKVQITQFGAQQLPRAIAVLEEVDGFVDQARSVATRRAGVDGGSPALEPVVDPGEADTRLSLT